MKTVTARFARQHFADILNEVHFGRKKILITRSGKPLVILISSRDYGEKEKKSKK
ncbi:type II toxin-antitoxin system Phd/YefM family antitoxin [Candidatus Curtissbacteria bacterium]|nr:type II toxin-antitoxin system Phd/YefM family antitoxin [Candidatus Curtissbacteria bacterium]